MSFFNFNKKKEKISLLFELRGDAVASSIIKTHTNDKPEVLYFNKRVIALREKINPERYTQIIIKELDKLAEETYKVGILKILKISDKNNQISEIHVILSSPWVLSQIKDIKIKKDKYFEINQDLLSNVIMNEEHSLILPEIFEKKEVKQEAIIKIIEEKIIQSKLNGYKINSIFQKRTNNLDINLFISISNNLFIENIKKTIRKLFIKKPVYLHSFALVGFSVIRNIMPQISNFIFIDIGAEVTEVCFITDDAIYKVFTYPFGKNSIIRKVAEETKTTYDTALAFINMQNDGKSEEKTMLLNENAFDKSVSDWINGLYKIFISPISRESFSREIFLFADNEITNLIGKKIKEDGLKSFNIINNDFNITLINNKKISSFISEKKSFEEDAILKVCSIFLNNLNH
ncbi:MAG: hypothetical protein WCC74_03085 [Minisyncoccia bacterium]